MRLLSKAELSVVGILNNNININNNNTRCTHSQARGQSLNPVEITRRKPQILILITITIIQGALTRKLEVRV